MASDLDRALDEALQSVPDCLLAGYIDVATGVLLAAKTACPVPREALDLLSSTAADFFEHADLGAVENWLIKSQEVQGMATTTCQEFMVMSDQLLHMYTRCKDNSDHIVALIAKRSANVGLMIAKSRKAAGFIDIFS